MNIGLYFGSFNPVHYGHLILAQTVLNESSLDAVWFVVSPQNPFKEKKNLESAYDRLKMVELAIEGHTALMASNVEFSLPKPSFTIDTLTHLSEQYKSYHFSLVMGEDNLVHFHKWKNYEAILKYYQIYVYPRMHKEQIDHQFKDHQHVHFFNAPQLHISATHIRRCNRAGKSIRFLVPESVRAYIQDNHLYEH